MNPLRTSLRMAAILSGLFLPVIVHASPSSIVDTVAGPLVGSPIGGSDYGTLYANVMLLFVGLADIVGIVFIARAGLTLVAQQGEDEIGKAKKTIGAIAGALILINLAKPIADALNSMGEGGASKISEEVLGVVDFCTTIAGVLAVIALIVSGIRAVTSYGGEDGWTALKRSLVAVISGVVLIGARKFVSSAVVEVKNPSPILEVIVMIMNGILGFGALIATIVIIYAGLMMIINVGSDDRATKAKNLILRVAIGLIIILAAMAIVNLVIVP